MLPINGTKLYQNIGTVRMLLSFSFSFFIFKEELTSATTKRNASDVNLDEYRIFFKGEGAAKCVGHETKDITPDIPNSNTLNLLQKKIELKRQNQRKNKENRNLMINKNNSIEGGSQKGGVYNFCCQT